jgi:microcystin-dependent protein
MEGTIGQILLYAGRRLPMYWFLCDGRLLEVSKYPALYSLIGTKYGGDGTHNFALPNLKDAQLEGIHYMICAQGQYPLID